MRILVKLGGRVCAINGLSPIEKCKINSLRMHFFLTFIVPFFYLKTNTHKPLASRNAINIKSHLSIIGLGNDNKRKAGGLGSRTTLRNKARGR